MTCHCGKIYPQSIPGIHYFETWWKSKCKSCKSCETETACCSTECSNNYTCKSCKRDININTILTNEQQLES